MKKKTWIDVKLFKLRLRFSVHELRVSGGDLHHVRAVHHGRHDPVLHGGHRVRQAVEAQEPLPDPHVQQVRVCLPQGGQALLHVQGGRHEEVAYHWSHRQRSSHQEEDHGRGRDHSLLPHAAGRPLRQWRQLGLPYLASHYRARDHRKQPILLEDC
ncbi:UNVERIFIED_CONTAM: hypothetical protein NCL1_27244 [Trichonephila clavipes]